MELFEVLFLLVHNRSNINFLESGAKVIERILQEEFLIIKKKCNDIEPQKAQEFSDFLGTWVHFIDLLAAHYVFQRDLESFRNIFNDLIFEYLKLLVENEKFLALNFNQLTKIAGEKLEGNPVIYQLFNRKILRTLESISGVNVCQLFLYNLLHFIKYLEKEDWKNIKKIAKFFLILLQKFQNLNYLNENIMIFKLIYRINKKVPDIFNSEILAISLALYIKQAASFLKLECIEHYSMSTNYDCLTKAFRFIERFQIFDRVFPEIPADIQGREFVLSLIGEFMYSSQHLNFSQIYTIFSSKIVNYTVPQELILASILKESNNILTLAFNTIINAMLIASRDNPSNAVQILLLDLENNVLTEQRVFGTGKFLFNLIERKVINNLIYFQWLYSASNNSMRSIDLQSTELNDKKYIDTLNFQENKVIKRIWGVLIDKDLDSRIREILENTLLLLASRSEITPYFFDLPSEIITSLEQATISHNHKFIVNLLQKCLMVFKYKDKLPEIDLQNSNIANLIIQYISQQISTRSNKLLYSLYDLLFEFLSPDKACLRYSEHLNCIYYKNTWTNLLPYTVDFLNDFLFRFLHLIEIFYTQSETIKQNMKNQRWLPKINFASKCVSLSLKLPEIRMQKEIILKILKLAFEKEVDISKRTRNNVKNPYFIFVSIKLLRSLAKKSSLWQKEALDYLSYIMDTIGSDFNNIILLSKANWISNKRIKHRVGILDELIRFLFVFRDNSERASVVAQYITTIAACHSNPNSIKLLFRRLFSLPYESIYWFNFIEIILRTFHNILSEESHMEFYSFNGKCGIELTPSPNLLREGYGFFGWIRIEISEIVHPMTIFQHIIPNEIAIELFLNVKSQLCYSLTTVKSRESPILINLTVRSLPYSKWIFVEFYHFSEKTFLYLNGEEANNSHFKKICTKKVSTSFIGCRIARTDKEGEQIIENGFIGQMGTIYFVSVTNASISPIHHWIKNHFRTILMHNLFPVLAQKESISLSNTSESPEKILLNHLVLCCNPKYSGGICKPGEKIFEFFQKGSKSIELYNHTQNMINKVKISHNVPAKEGIGNLGGARCFLPFFHKLAQINVDEKTLSLRNNLIAHCLDLTCFLLTYHNSISFFEGSDDLLLLRFLLEKLAQKGELTENIFNAISMMQKLIGNYYPSAMGKYLENISLNIDIWRYSKYSLQEQLFVLISNECEFQDELIQMVNPQRIFDLMLNSIEVYNTQANSQDELILLIVRITTSLGKKIFSGELLHTCVSYANIYYERRLKKCENQIRSVLLIFHELYFSKEESLNFLKSNIKENKESKILVSIFSIFDYYVFQKRYQGKKFYLKKKKKAFDEEGPKMDFWDPYSEQTVDEILAITIYWLLMFDFSILSEFHWKKLSESEQNKNILGFLINHYEKAAGLPLWKSPMIQFIFGGNPKNQTILFGLASYSAFILISFKLKFNILNGKQCRETELLKLLSSKSVKQQKYLIINKHVFTQIFVNIHKFNMEARNGLISDLLLLNSDSRLIPELCEDSRIVEVIFSQDIFLEYFFRLLPIQTKLLYYMIGEPKLMFVFVKIMQIFRSEGEYLVEVISGLMDNILHKPLNLTPEYKCSLLFLGQFIEEVLLQYPTLIPLENTVQTFSKFFFVLYHSGLMYVSYPVLSMYDERGVGESPDTLGKREALREGGFMRIMLKLLFILCKFDNKTNIAIILLKFYLFRKKEERKQIKKMAGVLKQEGKSGKNHLKMTYNFFDLIDIDSKKIKKHNEISKAFQSGIIAEFPTLLDLKKGEKTKQPSTKNIFENRAFLFSYVITECAHIILYEFYQVSSIEQFPKDAFHSPTFKKFRSNTADFFSKMNPKVLVLVEIIKVLVEKEISILKSGKKIISMITEFEHLLSEAGTRISLYSRTPKLESLHSELNQIRKDDKHNIFYCSHKEEKDSDTAIEGHKSSSELIKDCVIYFSSFFNSLCTGMKGETVTFSYSLIILLNGNNFFTHLFSNLLFTTTHQFKFIDHYVRNKLINFENSKSSPSDEQNKKFSSDLKKRIRYNFAYIKIPYEKIARDELREKLSMLSSKQYQKFEKEITSEVGIQYNKKEDLEHRNFVSYIKSKYDKVLKRCPLHNQLLEGGRIRPNSFTELVSLSLYRDSLGRAQKFKRLNLSKLKDLNVTKILFEYLRYFVLKKLMILHIMGKKNINIISEGFFYKDFSGNILKSLYLSSSPIPIHYNSSLESFPESDGLSVSTTSLSNPHAHSQFEEYLPRDSKLFEVEVVIPKGAVFGKLILNTICLSFKTEERKLGKKYCFGSTSYNHCFKRLNKKWQLSTIKEVLVKRYNLIRQAVEIYFDNSKSVFILFFSDAKLKTFLGQLKKRHGSCEIVEEPEMHFIRSKYAEQWAANEISNFQYLILLNKYGGRTYNDIGQYPIFPWIIGDYDSQKLDLSQPKNYRDLELTISGLTPVKRESAQVKYEILLGESEMDAFQFGTLYLTARTVLGYLLRIEPFASHLIVFEGGMDASERMFHILSNSWNGCRNDVSDNRELIPEFFYLPEMFGNYNNYSFGNRSAENDKNVPKCAHRVRVDQAVMPCWAKDNHHFVKKNFLALESRITSENLNNWIDLIFGELQQSPKHFNCFKAFVDEENVKKRINDLNDNNITEIQEFGSIPIKIFKSNHIERNMKEYDRKNKFLIFQRERFRYVIFPIKIFDSSIISIECLKNRIFVLTKAQKMYRSKEEYLNVSHEKQVTFEKNEVQLYPHQTLFGDYLTHKTSDAGRNIILMDEGNLVITCKHFDDSCTITNFTDKTIKHLYYHKTRVMCLCAYNTGFCSGSIDGVLVKWNLSRYKAEDLSHIEWSFCDHQSCINTIDVCDEIDLVASASTDGTISLRHLSSGKFLRLLFPTLEEDYKITLIRISPRGYLIIILRLKFIEGENVDCIQIFSVNGEFIKETRLKGLVNCIVMDKLGYHFILGGMGISLCRYSVLSLKSINLLDYLDEELPNQEKLKEQLVSPGIAITSLGLTAFENFQQLLVGLSTGELVSLKCSSRLAVSKQLNLILSALFCSREDKPHLEYFAPSLHKILWSAPESEKLVVFLF